MKTATTPITFEDIRDIIKSHKNELRSRYKIKTIGVFGSYVRGEQKKRSDVDILVEYRVTPDFIEFIKLEDYLAGLLGRKVDLVTKGALKPYIGERILEEVVYL
jgi:predicted nucleotidyltransferase